MVFSLICFPALVKRGERPCAENKVEFSRCDLAFKDMSRSQKAQPFDVFKWYLLTRQAHVTNPT
jgi:hypothetical protein